MASLHKDPRGKSPFWYMAYRGADGRRVFKSTKQTDRRKALEFSLSVEKAAQEGRAGHLTETRARELIGEAFERSTGKALQTTSTKAWLTKWISEKETTGDLSSTTRVAYRHAINLFLKHLGAKADESLVYLSVDDIQGFKLGRVGAGLTAKTVDRDLKVLRSALKQARTNGLIGFDPSQAVALISRKSKRKAQAVTREIFSAGELDTIAAAATGEWLTALLIGRYTGARLSDCVSMSWSNVDLNAGLIRYSDAKTGKDYAIPIHSRLEKHLVGMVASDDPRGVLCPKLSTKASGGKYGLSREFRRIMARAGVDDRSMVTKAVKVIADKQRHLARRSFHSIRHTYNTELANADVPQEIRRKLVGHSSDDVNDIYTHLDLSLFRGAIDKLS